MPDFCAAVGCSNQRGSKTKEEGITFHRFPKDKVKRKAWTAALRRRGFEPNDRSVICSSHFNSEDFDMTGQTTRLREGVTPTIFIFSEHLRKVPSTPRTSSTSQKAVVQSPEVHVQVIRNPQDSISDHQYALDPNKVKKRLNEAQDKVEELQRVLRNAKDRERRHKKMVKSLLKDLKDKNMLTAELLEELDLFSDLPI